jgi:hypothetical protein
LAHCRFEFAFGGTGASLVATIRSRVRDAGGSFEGSDTAGDFCLPTPIGEFRGRYMVATSSIAIEVDEKPFFVPCSAIEAKLLEYVENAR